MEADASPSQSRGRRLSGIVRRFWVDVVLFVIFVLEMNMTATGEAIHEWLGIAAGGLFVIHLLLHWEWIVSVTRRIVGKLPIAQRIKYIVDILLFIDLVIVGATGLWISEVAMRQIGVQFESGLSWRWLHSHAADWAVWLIGLHLALNWGWVVNALKRCLWQPVTGLRRRAVVSEGGAE
jgi:hypothetical protein